MKRKVGITKAVSLLRDADNILIFTHERPDFDTIGSAMALEYALKKLGKTAQFVCSDRLSERFYLIRDKLDTEISIKPETVVCVDMAADTMFGKYRDEYADKVLLSIDHHATDTPYAKYTYCAPEASATAELIYKICTKLGVLQDKTIAKYLYCAISSDSGCFKYSNTTSQTHNIAAKLIETGIDHAYLDRMMFDTRTKEQIELERRILPTLRYYANGKIAVMAATLDMCEQSGADISDVDALVQIPRTVAGVEVGIMIKQQDEKKYKVSVRSNDYFDSSAFAALYGGGGHVRASGFTVYADDASKLSDEIASRAEKLL